MIQKHRISTNIGKDQIVNLELKQDFDFLEVLSLRFTQQDVYSSMCSDYGVVCGRISVNNGLGVPNARVSLFVPQLQIHSNDPVISALYPYTEIGDKDSNNYRYNLLPSRKQHGGHEPTGTFFDQEDILTREEVLEVYETYYSYTVKTNSSGDFMIWGVPLGQQTIHVDVDLSDIGCFSLRPYDFMRQGDGVDKFKNKYTFKASEDLNTLPQIVSFDKTIEVYPFWGNDDFCEIGLTRTDFDLSDKGINITPTAFIIGGIYGDNGKSAVNKNCRPKKKMGRKCDLVAKSGKIEAIRFTPKKETIIISGTSITAPILEEVNLNEDIPDDGGFVFPIEMNMDYVYTNEFGENEITNDPNKGVPTSACYRFRINMNDNDLSRVRVNADYLIPNIREYHTGGTISDTTIDDRSYYFGTNWSGYPINAVSTNSNYGILHSELGEYYPRDYFYRFNYNKVYTVSSFHSNYQVGGNFANINELHPSEEEDCGDKLTPPSNFGFRNYTFTLLIADFLLSLDFLIKFLTLQFLNFATLVFNTIIELLISLTSSGRGLRNNLDEFQINNTTKLSLINYPECIECSSETSTVGGGTNTNQFETDGGCDLYDTLYDESLATGYFIVDNINLKLHAYPSCSYGWNSGAGGLPENYKRKYVPTLVGLSNYTLISTAIYGSGTNKLLSNPVNKQNGGAGGDFGPLTSGIRDIGCHGWGYQGGPATPSGRSEFKNGVFYIIPGTQTPGKLTGLLREYYRRKRVGKMFCGGIVNYAFIDNWLSGSLYFTQFKAKRIITAINRNSEKLANYCRDIARLVVGQKKLYYRSAPTLYGTDFYSDNINKPTTFVDLGPRDEFIKEICIDPKLDPNCSVSRSIGATSYQDLGELLGLAINYRMDVANTSGNLDMFFKNDGFSNGVGISNVLDGDILQLLSINNETGIEEFDLQNPKYLGYQFNVLDPEEHPQVFKGGTSIFGPLPLTLELSDSGSLVRSCLNEPGRLTESSQKVPFYLWDKKGNGFGDYGTNKNNQSWDYSGVQSQPLQGMTYGYRHTESPNDPSDQYLLLPMTYTFSGLSIGGNIEISGTTTEFDVISDTDNHSNPEYSIKYPGFTYLYVTGGTEDNPTSGTLYTRYGDAGTWEPTPWTNTTFIIKRTQDYYSGNKQILSTPFQFYFGLNAGKTGMDKFIDLFGPKGAFPPAE